MPVEGKSFAVPEWLIKAVFGAALGLMVWMLKDQMTKLDEVRKMVHEMKGSITVLIDNAL